MLFHELYGIYFSVVADILTEAAEGCLTDRQLTARVQEKAFAESVLAIPAALKSGDWPLLDNDMRPVLRHRPSMPMTALQKRWLKALLLDPRIALFAPDATGLEEVEPLYRPETFVLFDRYADGDPYTDAHYIRCFRTILQSIREKRQLEIQFCGRTGVQHTFVCVPYRLEYSEKDDKFRLLAVTAGKRQTVNLARVQACKLLDEQGPDSLRIPEPHLKELVFQLWDERNALERVLLHFSHFKKETLQLDDRCYQVKLWYDRDDETELLIRILSFGPLVQVTAPEGLIEHLRSRIERQVQLSFPDKVPPAPGAAP